MRDPIDVSEEWIDVALQGGGWETRDAGDGLSLVQRGTDGDGDTQSFIETPVPYEDACHIERLLEMARIYRDAANARLGPR